ncbi:peptidoglycan DD-metalloendopeptidase family protein [Mammaliicoccus sciuri]|uniref:peptidoglycan DD-metalloendopeptidase family protein n=2 Tax=Mammaliicoccus sciuri TaxID=1296 RepID=UPI0037AC5088
MLNAIDYLTKKGWKVSSDPRKYDNYPKNYGYRNYIENGVNYDSFCGGYHRAFDVYNNATDNVPAVTSGTVITSNQYGNFGGTIEIRDSNGNDWIYGHLQRPSLKFSVGDKVNQGDTVGLQGSSNYYDNPMSAHLHIQLRPKGTKTDEVSLVCSGIPIEKYDITKLNQKLDQSKNKGANNMKVINQTITGYNMPNRGGNPKGVVIHNDAGSSSAQQYYNSLINAPLSRLENGIAHYYIDRNTTWRALDTFRIAWHTANAYGNNNYIGYEVVQSMSASDKDFKANEQAVFKQAAEDLKYYGLHVNRNTVRLHNEFVATQCPHRSMALHAGYTSSQRAPQSVVNRTKDYFISQIKNYYNGGTTPKPPKTTWKWSGKATAKKGVSPIAAKKKPGLNEPALAPANNILAGQYINFFSVTKKDGYWWAEFEYPTNPKAGRFYCALGPITHKDGKLEKEAKLWFDLKITSKK